MRTKIISKITGCPGDKVPFNNFKTVKHSKYGTNVLAGYCRKCEQVRAHIKHACRVFNVSPEQYYEQLSSQDFECWICGATKSYDGSRLGIDHDHDWDGDPDKQFNRGFLCRGCNELVGDRGVGENVDLAERLYHYLLRAELLKKQFKEYPELLEQGGFPKVKQEPTN